MNRRKPFAQVGLAVPASPSASANSIIVQGRAKAPGHLNSPTPEHYATIPPMSMVFRYKSNTYNENKTRVRNLFANVNCAAQLDKKDLEFRGVSIEGINGHDSVKFGEARNRFAYISRGIATIMVNNAHLKKIKVGDTVGYELGTNSSFPAGAFLNFHNTPVATLKTVGPFDPTCIGEVISKPGKNDQSNWCSVLLYGS